jgi:hypothetical protein
LQNVYKSIKRGLVFSFDLWYATTCLFETVYVPPVYVPRDRFIRLKQTETETDSAGRAMRGSAASASRRSGVGASGM